MAKEEKTLPETMIAPETGALLSRGVRPFTVTYKGESVTVDLPGYYPEGEGDGVVVGDDMRVVDETLRALKEKLDGVPSPATIRRIRRKLKLSQRKAGELLKSRRECVRQIRTRSRRAERADESVDHGARSTSRDSR